MRIFLAAIAMMVLPFTTALADSPFIITGVEIDARASNALEAQTVAMREGQVEAARRLIARLTLPEDRAALGGISADSAAGMIAGLQVENERRSATRYLGDLTVNFDPPSVRRFLQSAGVPFVETQARDTLVLPVLSGGGGDRLWDGNPWLEAWQQSGSAYSLTPMRVPDVEAARYLIDAAAASGFDTDALQSVADAFGVSRVVVAIARGGDGSVRYDGATYTFGAQGVERRDPISTTAISGSFETAVARFVGDMEMQWKRDAVVRGSGTQEMRVTILYRNLAEWRRLQQAVASASLITDARLDAMSRDGALMTLSYRGAIGQLERELDARGAVLVQDPQIGTVVRAR